MASNTDADPFGIKNRPENDQNTVIENRDKLKISHIPEELKFRQKEINQLVGEVFQHTLKGQEGEDVVITGKPGTGKTAAVKYVDRKIHESYDTENMEMAYINCKTNNSKQEVFKAIMNSLGLDYKRGVGVGENITKMLKEFKDPGDPALVIILDEVDELYKARRDYINDVLYTLSRPNEHSDGFQFKGDLNIICVSNDNQLYEYLDFDVDDSSFSPERFEFLQYQPDEITEILMERQKEAYSDIILDKAAMRDIAEVVHERFNGDIRVGIRILKKIPKHLNEDLPKSDVNQAKVVEKSIEDVKRSRIEKVLNGKDEHFLLVVSSMLQNMKKDKNKLSYIVDGYRRACEKASIEKNKDDFDTETDESKARSRSFVRRKLEYLVDENIVTKEKKYDKPRNPYFYEPEVDVDLFEEMVNERLKRNGIATRFQEKKNSRQEELEKEAEEKMEKFM